VVNQHAELVTGVSVPFRTVELTVGEMTEQDALYLCMDNAARPLLLLPLAQLRRRSDSAQDTCFFTAARIRQDADDLLSPGRDDAHRPIRARARRGLPLVRKDPRLDGERSVGGAVSRRRPVSNVRLGDRGSRRRRPG
jgi:hypothetical protein